MGKKPPEIIDAEFRVLSGPDRPPAILKRRPRFLRAVRAGLGYISRTGDMSFPDSPWWFGLLCHLIYYAMFFGAALVIAIIIWVVFGMPGTWLLDRLWPGSA